MNLLASRRHADAAEECTAKVTVRLALRSALADEHATVHTDRGATGVIFTNGEEPGVMLRGQTEAP